MRIQKLIKKEKKYFAKILEKHKNISEKKKKTGDMKLSLKEK